MSDLLGVRQFALELVEGRFRASHFRKTLLADDARHRADVARQRVDGELFEVAYSAVTSWPLSTCSVPQTCLRPSLVVTDTKPVIL